jgi:hypothetical protein
MWGLEPMKPRMFSDDHQVYSRMQNRPTRVAVVGLSLPIRQAYGSERLHSVSNMKIEEVSHLEQAAFAERLSLAFHHPSPGLVAAYACLSDDPAIGT